MRKVIELDGDVAAWWLAQERQIGSVQGTAAKVLELAMKADETIRKAKEELEESWNKRLVFEKKQEYETGIAEGERRLYERLAPQVEANFEAGIMIGAAVAVKSLMGMDESEAEWWGERWLAARADDIRAALLLARRCQDRACSLAAEICNQSSVGARMITEFLGVLDKATRRV